MSYKTSLFKVTFARTVLWSELYVFSFGAVGEKRTFSPSYLTKFPSIRKKKSLCSLGPVIYTLLLSTANRKGRTYRPNMLKHDNEKTVQFLINDV